MAHAKPGSQALKNSHGSPSEPMSPETSCTQLKLFVPGFDTQSSPTSQVSTSSGSQSSRQTLSNPSPVIEQLLFSGHVGSEGDPPHWATHSPSIVSSSVKHTAPTSQSSNPRPKSPSMVQGSPTAAGSSATGTHADVVGNDEPSSDTGAHLKPAGQSCSNKSQGPSGAPPLLLESSTTPVSSPVDVALDELPAGVVVDVSAAPVVMVVGAASVVPPLLPVEAASAGVSTLAPHAVRRRARPRKEKR